MNLCSPFSVGTSKELPISGPLLQSLPLVFAEELAISDFWASNGWLTSWKQRYKIKQFKISGESSDVDPVVISNFKKRIGDIFLKYNPKGIFICDETDLFYHALPDETLAQKWEKVKGDKQSKERMTVLFACSFTGEKLKPVVIGKAQKPRAIMGIDISQLPGHWRFNEKAWMTSKIFNDWLCDLNRRMRLHKQSILLFMDNCSSHACKGLCLSNTSVRFSS